MKYKFELHGTINIKIRFGTDEIEVDVPDDVEDTENYIKNTPEYQDAFSKEIQYIHNQLKETHLYYYEKDDRQDEINYWEDNNDTNLEDD